MVDHEKMPLIDALKSYHREKVIPFDVPGHKHGKGLKEYDKFLRKYGMELDVNSMKSLDIISNPKSVIKEAEDLLADAYGADYSFFMIGGTTSAVQAMIMSSVNPGEKIIIPRNAHKSAINGLILSGAIPVYIQPEIDEKIGIAMGMSIDNIKKAIKNNPDAKAIFVINPTYYGITSDLKLIIKLAHDNNMLVLSDEAHGAHFAFNPILPESGIALGVDMAAVSLHKTGGTLTQSSALLMNKNKVVDYNHLRNTINLILTTSASYFFMASIDFARKQLVLEGEKRLDEIISICRKYRILINEIPGLYAFGKELIDGIGVCDFDETKLSVNVVNLDLTGYEVYDLLREKYHIQAELADAKNVLFIISLGDDEYSLSALYDALKEIGEKHVGGEAWNFRKTLSNPELIVSPRNAYYSKKKTILLSDAVGEISGELVMVYPPGIPIITPGERISSDIVEYIEFLKGQDTVITGPDDSEVKYIKVLGM
ncbi:MAG: aminotransferase class I/II-fold pyridoxal phosphate-dependent enzyme [Clostridiales bacterium]|nr:aminotransferase class I/II-fold pyridoxal phosphate-dependent enzyme [Clostridiales bacterium]